MKKLIEEKNIKSFINWRGEKITYWEVVVPNQFDPFVMVKDDNDMWIIYQTPRSKYKINKVKNIFIGFKFIENLINSQEYIHPDKLPKNLFISKK